MTYLNYLKKEFKRSFFYFSSYLLDCFFVSGLAWNIFFPLLFGLFLLAFGGVQTRAFRYYRMRHRPYRVKGPFDRF